MLNLFTDFDQVPAVYKRQLDVAIDEGLDYFSGEMRDIMENVLDLYLALHETDEEDEYDDLPWDENFEDSPDDKKEEVAKEKIEDEEKEEEGVKKKKVSKTKKEKKK